MEQSDKERLAVVESELKTLGKQNAELLIVVTDIRAELTRYKGFIGACLFFGGTILSLLDIFRDFFIKH